MCQPCGPPRQAARTKKAHSIPCGMLWADRLRALRTGPVPISDLSVLTQNHLRFVGGADENN